MIASAENSPEKMPYLKSYDYKNVKVNVTAGDFPVFMGELVKHMEEARNHVVDENQGKMIDHYIEHFKFGDIDVHKESQKNWIKDIGPAVESNIGFIETY
jgi:dipeptidyl-peptidase-3